MMKVIDRLPHGPAWRAVTLTVKEGDAERVIVVYVRNVM